MGSGPVTSSTRSRHTTLPCYQTNQLPSYSSHTANTSDASYNYNTINNNSTVNTNNTGNEMDIEEGGQREEGEDR